MVAIDWHAAISDHEYVVAPLVDDNNPFADDNKFGYRFLVVRQTKESDYDGRLVEFVVSGHPQSPTEAAMTALSGARAYLLGNNGGFIEGFTGWFLTYSTEYVKESGWVYQDGKQQQQVQMSAAITHELIDKDPKDSSLATKYLAVTNCVTATVCGSVTVFNRTNPTVNCASSITCSHYTIDVDDWGSGSGAGGGGGDTGWGSGGSSGGGGPAGPGQGQGPGPMSVPNMPQTMPRQTGAGGCVPASLAQVKLVLCNTGNQTAGQVEGAMFMYGFQHYGWGFVQDGVPLSGMAAFIDNFFYSTPVVSGNYQGAIDSGHPIMIDVYSQMASPIISVWHSVVATGYNPSNTTRIYYLDPAIGTTKSGNGPTLFSSAHYATAITGCK